MDSYFKFKIPGLHLFRSHPECHWMCCDMGDCVFSVLLSLLSLYRIKNYFYHKCIYLVLYAPNQVTPAFLVIASLY